MPPLRRPVLKRPAHWPRWARFAVTALAVVAVLGATAVVGYRVLAPAETAVEAHGEYPERPEAAPVRYGDLTSAPLIVDGRLRVYADARRVWADTSLTARTEMTPYWAYRRWPAEVAGVVAVEGNYEGVALVIVKFSDGVVVALNPRSGRVAWQDQARASVGEGFDGRRTGAATVYRPAGIFTARSSTDGGAVLVVAGGDEVIGYNPWTGKRRWEFTFTEHPGCHDTDWTGETTYVAKDSCTAPATVQVFDAATGKPLVQNWQPPGASAGPAEAANWYVEPMSCTRGHSGCSLFKASGGPAVISAKDKYEGEAGTTGGVYRLNYDGTITPEPFATGNNTFLQGDLLIQNAGDTNGYIRAVERAGPKEKVVWTSKEGGLRLVAVGLLGAYAITSKLELVVLHPTLGVELSRTDLRKDAGERWVPGFVHTAGRFVAVERTTGGSPKETDDRYYSGSTPVVLAGV
jgi:outer membrane protein assembly factor BamB